MKWTMNQTTPCGGHGQTSSYDETRRDGVLIGSFVWAGFDSVNEGIKSTLSNSSLRNATTFIHETGHMLGLDDYYDIDPEYGPDGGAGGGDMMDAAVGDHGPASKILLGWAKPQVINESRTVTLKAFESTGDCIVIKKDAASNNFNCEYIVIDLYTPTGLHIKANGYLGLPDETAVRIWHIDANNGRRFFIRFQTTAQASINS